MKTELNSKEYVSFARRFVKETVATMDIDELRSIVTNHIHEEIQNGENDFGQEGAFEEMQAWDQDIFDSVAKDYDLTLEAWRERFLAKRTEMKDLFDEKFCKTWEYYLSSTSSAFRYRDLLVFQIQLIKNFHSSQRTRDYIYFS